MRRQGSGGAARSGCCVEDLLEDADNEIEERIDNKLNQVALIIKLGYKTSQLAHRVWSLQDKYFGKSCP